MAGYLGGTGITGVYLGGVAVTGIYRGATRVWGPDGRIRLDFNGANQTLEATGDWDDFGPSGTYKAAIVDGRMRLGLPDGLVGEWFLTSRARYDADVLGGDDGYIEARVASRGDGSTLFSLGQPYRTHVYRRVNNTGSSVSNAVGFELAASQVSIVRRVGSTDTVMQECGAFAAGDRVRLRSVGNLHELYVNGEFRDDWNDSGASVAKGSSNRKIAVRVDASKDPLGPRRFSPALDWLEAA